MVLYHFPKHIFPNDISLNDFLPKNHFHGCFEFSIINTCQNVYLAVLISASFTLMSSWCIDEFKKKIYTYPYNDPGDRMLKQYTHMLLTVASYRQLRSDIPKRQLGYNEGVVKATIGAFEVCPSHLESL